MDGDKIASVSLCSLGDLVDQRLKYNDIHNVGELAYYWVSKEYRGKEVGRMLFEKPIEHFVANSEGYKLVFTTAMGVSAGKDAGKNLLRVLLKNEKAANGVDGDVMVIIGGERLDFNIIQELIDIKNSDFCVREQSLATPKLAITNDMEFVGFSKNLSPTYTNVV